MRKLLLISVLFFAFSSCNKNESKKKYKPNERVKDFRTKLIMNTDDMIKFSKTNEAAYHQLSSKKLNPKTDTVEYKNREILISYLTITRGCAEYVGDININEDSIFLKLVNSNGIVCPEPLVERVKFRIANPENKKYKIIKE